MLCYAKSLQSCPTLCDPTDSSPPGSTVPGILQARTLEWVAISFSNAWKWKVKVKSLSHVWLLATPWTAAYQSPPSRGFSRQEYWSGVPLPWRCSNVHPSATPVLNESQNDFFALQSSFPVNACPFSETISGFGDFLTHHNSKKNSVFVILSLNACSWWF